MRIVAWLVVGACYGPHPPAGVACADNGDCPSGLHCVPLTNTCEATDPQPGADAGADAQPSDDARIDAATDAVVQLDCWPAWRTGAPVFSTPSAETKLNTPTDDVHPWLSADGLTVFYATGQAAATQDIYSATRIARDQPFKLGAPFASLNSSSQ